MTYDHWKTTNPADQFLGPEPLGCQYCEGAGPEPGWIEQDNNGPIVPCPFCNPCKDDEGSD